jgi:hypothetical protein
MLDRPPEPSAPMGERRGCASTKLTEQGDGELRFRSVPPLLVPLRDMFDEAHPQDETKYVREWPD